jgi:hypothetical protein
MLCTLSRWMVSRAEDTGKKLPKFAERHVRRCAVCGEYARSSASLSSRLKAERSAWLDKVSDFPSGVESSREPLTQGPGTLAAAAPARRRPWLALHPLPVAAAALVIVAGALVLFQIVLKEPAPTAEERAAAIAAIKTLSSAPQGLQGVIGGAESSLDQERRSLERSVSSAFEYLQARLNIKIERREPPKSS